MKRLADSRQGETFKFEHIAQRVDFLEVSGLGKVLVCVFDRVTILTQVSQHNMPVDLQAVKDWMNQVTVN